jgi:hypothetical protein
MFADCLVSMTTVAAEENELPRSSSTPGDTLVKPRVVVEYLLAAVLLTEDEDVPWLGFICLITFNEHPELTNIVVRVPTKLASLERRQGKLGLLRETIHTG